MNKQRRIPFLIILFVIAATLYNIVPTLFYYSKPLNEKISEKEALSLSKDLEKRVSDIEKNSLDWIRSYCNLIHVKPLYIGQLDDMPGIIQVKFSRGDEAKRLRAFIPKAGSLIPFAPSKLFLLPQEDSSLEVLVQRAIPVKVTKDHFQFKEDGLVLDTKTLGAEAKQTHETLLSTFWTPKHPELKKEGNFSVFYEETNNSLFTVVKGVEKLGKLYAGLPKNDLTEMFASDLRALTILLYQEGFQIVPHFALPKQLKGKISDADLIFEKANFTNTIVQATRENFTFEDGVVKLALTNHEERILTQNKIDSEIQKELVKWKDDYRLAQVSLDPHAKYDVPKPTKSVFWNNLILSAKKYFRGDERKILKWGLDLSGGKSVQIELVDGVGAVVTNDADVKKGIEELTQRVNKMGVSEVTIRQVGHQIILDFPGSQSFQASDLIKASTMTFHVVNEEFSLMNQDVAEKVNQFLQEIWHEAVLTGKKDLDHLNAIAIRRLHSDLRAPSTEALWKKGLRLIDDDASGAPLSKIALFRGEERADWHGQNHPLLIVFKDAALEGSSLTNIHAGYDPSKGNFLSFEVSGNVAKEKLFSWANTYCKESITGAAIEAITHGRGWRMAAILNETVISTPSLEAPLKDGGMISGSFSQREVNRLASDLEAGSLTFTPRILLEKNIHPELGKSDRMKGIGATFVSLLLVIGSMIVYYRFAGFVAAVAVFFNLLILWAVLQNLEAVLTLGSIAAIILTVGMAVDANVLVFERIKEEYAKTKSMSLSLNAGYQKAYSAIIDSNLTTIIAALILLNFDAGPIKSFALNLLIGVASSMFSALFMTRFYFDRWIRKNPTATLTMSDWIRGVNFDFLKKSKISFIVASSIILIGSFFLWSNRSSIFGMDFTGGYTVNLDLASGDAKSVKDALVRAGVDERDVQVQQLQPATNVRVLLSTRLELPGKPFHNLPIERQTGGNFLFESNPRILWIVDALKSSNLEVVKQQLPELHSHWTAMSGQISQTMRTQAMWGLFLAFVSIFIYLAFRFEYRFATAALICLFHDVFISLACIGILHFMKVPVQIDLSTVAAIMTIIGYSLNDTIIIFDRIREEMNVYPLKNMNEIVNKSLNATLSRTTITSGTTLLVLIALVTMGGSSLFNFSAVMTIGVFFGTLSSWFIASPVLTWLHRDKKKKQVSIV